MLRWVVWPFQSIVGYNIIGILVLLPLKEGIHLLVCQFLDAGLMVLFTLSEKSYLRENTTPPSLPPSHIIDWFVDVAC